MQKILAIDFGTSTTLFADTCVGDVFEPTTLELNGRKIIPSIVQIDPITKQIEYIGFDAAIRTDGAHNRTLVEFKLGLATSKEYIISKDRVETIISVKELVTLFLKNLRKKLETNVYNGANISDIVSTTVIGFPVEWTEIERNETIQIAINAGFSNVIGCLEPVGALYYLHYKKIIDISSNKNIRVMTSTKAIKRLKANHANKK